MFYAPLLYFKLKHTSKPSVEIKHVRKRGFKEEFHNKGHTKVTHLVDV